MEYLYETHCHTDESSPCGSIPAKEVVSLYKEKGYSGIVFTDHMFTQLFERYSITDWDSAVSHHMLGYKTALKYADDGFSVLYGIEIRFDHVNNNDYLVYGMTEELLRSTPDICKMNIKTFHRFCSENGLLVLQAHPFRDDISVVNPKYLDGIEVFNGNKRHDSRCDIAAKWAEKFSMTATSGSDFHETEDLAEGGIYTNERISDIAAFTDIIRSGNFRMK